MPLRTNVDKALHQVKRGRRVVRARDFSTSTRDSWCACIGLDSAIHGCRSLHRFRRGIPCF